MRNNNFYKFIFWAYLLIVFICLASFLLSCNPVKQVLKDNNKIKQVWEAAVLDSWCVNDSVYVSDTTILLDTLHTLETLTDTVTVDNTITITKTEYKNIVKTVTIRDTTVVTDNSRIDLLQGKINDKNNQLIKKNEELIDKIDQIVSIRKDRNKWRLYFFALLAAFGVWIFKKPLLKLIKPI